MNFYFLSIILNVIFLYFCANNFYQRKITENEALDLYDDYEKVSKKYKELKEWNDKVLEEVTRLTIENTRLNEEIKIIRKKWKMKKLKLKS